MGTQVDIGSLTLSHCNLPLGLLLAAAVAVVPPVHRHPRVAALLVTLLLLLRVGRQVHCRYLGPVLILLMLRAALQGLLLLLLHRAGHQP